jgi:hypothetical protein
MNKDLHSRNHYTLPEEFCPPEKEQERVMLGELINSGVFHTYATVREMSLRVLAAMIDCLSGSRVTFPAPRHNFPFSTLCSNSAA